MMIFGYGEIKQFFRVEDGRLVFYGYSINYDRDGKEVSRTEPSRVSSLYVDEPVKPVPWWKKILRIKG